MVQRKQKVKFDKQLISLGVKYKTPRELAQKRIGVLVSKRLSQLDVAERKKSYYEPAKVGKGGRILRKEFKATEVLPGVRIVFDKARKIAKNVAERKIAVKHLKNPRYRAFFSPDEIGEMMSYLQKGVEHTKNRNLATALIGKGKRGVITPQDLIRVDEVFGDTGAAKFIIAYNDLLASRKKKTGYLVESRPIKHLRKTISEIIGNRERSKKVLALFRSLKTNKFISEAAFRSALRAISPDALRSFEGLDWRDKPFIIQYAVGNNQQIKNPYHNQWDYILDMGSLEKCEYDVNKAIKSIQENIAKLNQNLKDASIHYPPHMADQF